MRLIGPAPKRRGEIDTRLGEIDPVTTIRVGGRGSFLRSSVVPHAAHARASTAAIAVAGARPVAPRIFVVPPVPASGADGARSLLDGRVSPVVVGDLAQPALETVPGRVLGVLVLAALELAQVVPVPRPGGLLGAGTVAVLSGGGRGHSCLLSGVGYAAHSTPVHGRTGRMPSGARRTYVRVDLDRPLATAEFLCVDTETNGLAGDACELTEIGA